LSSAVAEKPEAPARTIVHSQDLGLLRLYGADLTDRALVEEYFEYRNLPGQGPGNLDTAILKMLVVAQRKKSRKGK
jgi:hypothetical protein